MNKLSKFLLSFCFLTFTFFAWNSYEAQGKLLGVSTENKRAANVVLPEHAADQAVIALGKSYDQDSQGMVEGYAIIRRNENYAKGGNKGGGKPGGVTSSCYGFLSSGMKWKTQEPWFVNTTNSDGLSELFVRNTMIDSVQKWEAAAGV
ncbi:MAG: hypothetical protein OEX81_05755, partial [Candidatus Pacebacteria bacterium]|nr:hypothetical protein [Candidatus Paceibacterota bacterium]